MHDDAASAIGLAIPRHLAELSQRVDDFVREKIIPFEHDPRWTAHEYARRRTAFGKVLGEHEAVSFMLTDNAMDIHTARLTIWHTAWLLDQGARASTESSMAKVICAEAIGRVADRSMQILGGLGTTRDTIVERIYRDVRSFRIYDGPSEVHRWALGRNLVQGRT